MKKIVIIPILLCLVSCMEQSKSEDSKSNRIIGVESVQYMGGGYQKILNLHTIIPQIATFIISILILSASVLLMYKNYGIGVPAVIMSSIMLFCVVKSIREDWKNDKFKS